MQRLPLAAFALALPLAIGCQSPAGSMSGKRYVAAKGVFSMPVPELGPGMVSVDKAGTSPQGTPTGFVTFSDDLGRMRSVTYEVLSEAGRSQLLADLAMGPSVVQSKHGAYLRDVIPQDLHMNGEEGRLIHERPLTLPDGEPAYFGVMEIETPHGAGENRARGFLVTIHAGVILVLAAEVDSQQDTPPQPGMEQLAVALEQLYRSMRFD